jgi:hypothetical protein
MGKDVSGNSLQILTSVQEGWRNGLQLELYAGHAQLQEKFKAIRGFRILVFNKSDMYSVAEDFGVDVANGMATNIGIKRTFIFHLP